MNRAMTALDISHEPAALHSMALCLPTDADADADADSIGNARSAAWLRFGPFSLRNHGEALYCHDDPVRVGSRARHILAILAARPGQVVSKADLMANVWPDTTVVDNNLTVHIAGLRQALGDGQDGMQYIVNVPGRGYRFVAPVSAEWDHHDAPAARPRVGVGATNLPAWLAPAIGLCGPLADVATKLRSTNMVTIVGPAGVGKTTLALHAAMARRAHHADGVWLVNLASITDPADVLVAIAATLRIELDPVDPVGALLSTLSQFNVMILLDNCEHLIDAVANLAVIILRHCPKVVLLATSREPLQISGEAIYSLAPLDIPPDGMVMTAQEALGYPAIQLLTDRATAASNDFALSDHDAAAAASICRRLDGLPLAIEIAATVVGTFGLPGLDARLDLGGPMPSGKRDAPLRHRTLTAALDWSYYLLTIAEQNALQCLAMFAGDFTLEGAGAIIRNPDLGEVGDLLASLHAKSLIISEISTNTVRFRLFETTRAFAVEKLKRVGDPTRIQSSYEPIETLQ